MTGPVTPHFSVRAVEDGVELSLYGRAKTVPVDMAMQIASAIEAEAAKVDPKAIPPLPVRDLPASG